MFGAADSARLARPRALVRYWQERQTVYADYGGPLLAVSLFGEGLARVRFAPGGTLAPRRSWATVPPDDVLPPVVVTLAEGQDGVEMAGGELAVTVAREGARVTVSEQASGRVLVADGAAGGPGWDPADGSARWIKRMPADERYYGLGERTGLLDKRGRRYTCWATDRYEAQGPGTDELYLAIPFLLALDRAGQSYGLLLNNTYRSAFDLTREQAGEYWMEVAGGELDYYVVHGPTPARVVERYTRLTGRPPLPPRWAFGYQQARWSYAPAERVRTVAAELRRRHIPCDALYLDIDYMDDYRVFTWDRERFPDPAGLIADLGEQGFKVVSLVDVGVKYQPQGGYDVYDEGVARGAFLRMGENTTDPPLLAYTWPGACVFPDFARPDVRVWWGGYYGRLLALSVSGFVNDMNEPAMHDRPVDDPANRRIDPPLTTPHGPPGERTTHAEVHNVYGYLETQGTYEALRARRPDQRILLLTRAGCAGIQRYAAVWTGDNASYWEHLEMSLPQLLNLGLSGVALTGVDVGGFYADCGPELLARWMALGAFYPLMRNNAAERCAEQEPWVGGPEVEAACRGAIELRYRLLPYLYTLAAEAARTGAPFLRPLLYHYPDDPVTHTLHDQALVGRDLLVAPVLRPGKTCREVYLPRGRWYDFHQGAPLAGGSHLLVAAPLAGPAPLYARGGAIVPCGPVLQWTDQRPLDPVTLEVFPDEAGRAEGALYEDDGASYGYERGQWCLTRFTCQPVAAGGAIVEAHRDGTYAPPPRAVEIRLHGDGAPCTIALPADTGAWRVEM